MKELAALLPYLRPHRTAIAWGIVLVVVSNFFTLAVPRLLSEGIDAPDAPGVTRNTILGYAGLIIVTALLSGAGRFGMRQILNGVSRRVELELRDDFFRHLLRLDAPFYSRTSTGEIISRATNDIQAVRMVAGPAYMYLVNMVVVSLLAVSMMLWISPRMTLYALLPMLALPAVTMGFGGIIHRQFERIQAEFGGLSTLAQENLAGVRIIKAYGQEAVQAERFRQASESYMQRNVEMARSAGLFHPLLGLLGGLALVVALLEGGRAILRGEVTVGEFVEFTLYLGMLMWPMISLGWVVNLFQRGAASMGRVSRILESIPDVREPEHPAGSGAVRGEIEFRDVSFRYPGADREVLRNLSFRVPPGSTVAIVGPTGSGKSTVVALLARLYDPTEGEVLLDGVPLDRWPLERLRGAIGIVPQDAFLFSATIRENLALGFEEPDPDATEERIRGAARVAQLDDTAMRLPAGYDTLLGERGINLSGGQKQRATLARAIARDPAILVMDDALSAVDTHTETEILRSLADVLEGRTSVIVSHRVTAVMNADLILALRDGALMEAGTHAELLRAGGTYAALQRRQLLAEDLNDEPLDDDPILARNRWEA